MKFRQNKKRIDPRYHLNEQDLDELCIPPDCKEISPVPVPTSKRDEDDENEDELDETLVKQLVDEALKEAGIA